MSLIITKNVNSVNVRTPGPHKFLLSGAQYFHYIKLILNKQNKQINSCSV